MSEYDEHPARFAAMLRHMSMSRGEMLGSIDSRTLLRCAAKLDEVGKERDDLRKDAQWRDWADSKINRNTLPSKLRLIADGRWRAPYGTGRAPADLEGDVLREAAKELLRASELLSQFITLTEFAEEFLPRPFAELGSEVAPVEVSHGDCHRLAWTRVHAATLLERVNQRSGS